MLLDLSKIKNPFVQTHLKYVESTEPPRLFHIWSALTCVSACLGRHAWLDTGIGKLYGNMFVLLVGPPGTRKSSAISFAVNLLKQAVDIRIAPDDTGGQRQGLIAAITELDIAEDDGATGADALDPDHLANVNLVVNNVDRHVMFAIASEFGSFIGQNNIDLTRFLIKMWDGDDYKYRLRKSEDCITDPLMTMIGGTTPTDISVLLPAEAIGQGFMSRNILVYAPHKDKTVPPSRMRLVRDLEKQLAEVYINTARNMQGPIKMTPDAQQLIDHLYMHESKMQDTRFIYYTERRATHLMKLAVCLCAARKSMSLTRTDVEEAHWILQATEQRMPDALGEYGLSPVAVARQKMLEYMRYAKEPVSERVLWAIMQRDMKLVDFRNSLAALVNAGRIAAIDTMNGRAYLYKDTVTKLIGGLSDDELEQLLVSNPHSDSAVN